MTKISGEIVRYVPPDCETHKEKKNPYFFECRECTVDLEEMECVKKTIEERCIVWNYKNIRSLIAREREESSKNRKENVLKPLPLFLFYR